MDKKYLDVGEQTVIFKDIETLLKVKTMKEKIEVAHQVTLYTDDVELCIYVNKDLGKDSDKLSHPFGHICDCVSRDSKFDFDNLSYFLDYNKEKQKEIKKELIEKRAWVKGLNKQIKALIKEAKRLKLM
jgi:hypothetical protein